MNTLLDIRLTFPCDEYGIKTFTKLRKFCDCVEAIESNFGIEFSCGDGKYISDLDDKELQKYDGEVCLKSMPRYIDSHKEFYPNKPYRFTIKIDKDEELRYYLNSKTHRHQH